MKQAIPLFLKGAAMGAANVIPGVSGGTVAFLTGIYETLIRSLKSFDREGIQLLLTFKIRDFLAHIHFSFLLPLGLGVLVSILSLAKILKYLFENYPTMLWAFFFGLILASILFVGRLVKKWSFGSLTSLLVGTGLALAIALMKPAEENAALWYLVICGVAAVSSMIIPGISGSYVLVLLGNYQLIMLEAVSDLDFGILLPVGLGAMLGLLVLARLLDWVFAKHHDTAIGLLTGFVAGSLLVIWPWKNEVYLLNEAGELLLKDGQPKVAGYDWLLPSLAEASTWMALGWLVLGFGMVFAMEWFGTRNQGQRETS
ncbi:MAG: DUF368 domain-containing protein [Verrucomicrobiota bacterium]